MIHLVGKRLRVFNDSWIVSDAVLIEDDKVNISVVGIVPNAQPGKLYTVTAEWTLHNQYGWQIKVSDARLTMPTSLATTQVFLSRLDGIGAINGKRLVEKYGVNAITVIKEKKIDAFLEANIHKAYAIRAMADFVNQESIILACEKLHAAGFRGRQHEVLLEKHKGNLVQDVLLQPDCILIPKVKFCDANQLWTLCGLAHNDPRRIVAGMREILRGKLVAQNGHCWLDKETLTRKTFCLFASIGVTLEDVVASFGDPCVSKNIICEPNNRVWCASVHRDEVSVCRRIMAIIQTPLVVTQQLGALEDLLESADVQLNAEQKTAILEIPSNKVSLLTGSAGTGKSTVIRWLISAFAVLGLKCKLCAYTGTAARLVASKSGHPAHTVHRLLEKKGDLLPERGSWDPLNTDVVIVDEFSMMPLSLTAELLDAVRDSTYLVFVGDPNQLPAVEQGAVLRDLINSKRIKQFHLSTVYRQEEHTGHILQLATCILRKERFLWGEYADLVHHNITDSSQCIQKVLDIWREYNRDPNKVKFLTYSWKNACGVDKLNEAITEDTKSAGLLGAKRRVIFTDYYDRMSCIWRKNVVDKEGKLIIANGQDFVIGSITQRSLTLLTEDSGDVTKHIMDKPEYFDGDYFTPGYARTVHSTQGRGYPVVVFIVQPTDYNICRECVYTALTRAEKKLIIIGDLKALYDAPSKATERRTGLEERLQ